MIVNCKQCNIKFKTIPAKIERGWGKYCSTDCYILSQKINKLGSKNPNWKGGIPKCKTCGGNTSRFGHPKRNTSLCGKCYLKVLSENGHTRWNWKGGISKTKQYRAYHHKLKRDKRKRNAIGIYSLVEWEALKMKYQYMCLCCKKQEPEVSLTVDHIIPLSRGGLNTIVNIQPLCRHCNNVKYTKVIDYRKEPLIINQ